MAYDPERVDLPPVLRLSRLAFGEINTYLASLNATQHNAPITEALLVTQFAKVEAAEQNGSLTHVEDLVLTSVSLGAGVAFDISAAWADRLRINPVLTKEQSNQILFWAGHARKDMLNGVSREEISARLAYVINPAIHDADWNGTGTEAFDLATAGFKAGINPAMSPNLTEKLKSLIDPSLD